MSYRGPEAPVTCLALTPSASTIFGGCWDKDIWSWDVSTGKPGRRYSGHSDFVKAVLCARISGTDILISGGADKTIIVWDVATGRRLHTLQDPTTTMSAVQHLALDPELTTPEAAVFASASSDPHVRRWKVTLDDAEQLAETFPDRPTAERSTIHEHETSVYRLFFDGEDDGGALWTASADGTAKCLPRARGFVADDEFKHGDYVRAVVATEQWVVTAGRDEDVKVWDRASGKLHCTLKGHYEEITDLVLMGPKVCSVSIDRTVRTWPLGKAKLDATVREIEEAKVEDAPEEDKAETGLTAEEEAELAALMEDD